MNIFLPYKHTNGEELRFALRSIEKNLSGYRDVYLITDKCPEWYNGKFILYPDPYPDVRGRRQFNIISKLFQVPEEKFVMWNDDHYLLKPLHVNEIKNWYEGTLKEAFGKSHGEYHKAVRNTFEHFGDVRYFD